MSSANDRKRKISNTNLPRWAKIIPHQKPKNSLSFDDDIDKNSGEKYNRHVTSQNEINETDAHLRLQSQKYSFRAIDHALEMAWREVLMPSSSSSERYDVISSVTRFIDMFLPSHDDYDDDDNEDSLEEVESNSSLKKYHSSGESDNCIAMECQMDVEPTSNLPPKTNHHDAMYNEVFSSLKFLTIRNFGGVASQTSNITSKNNSDDSENRAKHDILSSAIQHFFLPPKFDPFILPLVILKCPSPSIEDRTTVAKILQSGLMNSSSNSFSDAARKNKSAAVAWIRCGPIHYYGRHAGNCGHGELIRLILLQCLSQEPEGTSKYSHLLNQQRKRGNRYSTYSSAFVEWASRTELFHSVILILEDPETIPVHALDGLLSTLTSFRSTEGIPISLISLHIRHVDEDCISHVTRCSISGEAGVETREFNVPSSSVVLNHLMDNLFVNNRSSHDKNTTHHHHQNQQSVLFSKSLMTIVRKSFDLEHASVAKVASQMKLALAHHFAKPGSFVSMVCCEEFMCHYWRQLSWFCVDKQARSFLLSYDNSKYQRQNTSSQDMARWIRIMMEGRCAFSVSCRMLNMARRRFSSSPSSSSTTNIWKRNIAEICLTNPSSGFYQELMHWVSQEVLKSSSLNDLMVLVKDWKVEIQNEIRCWKKLEQSDPHKLFYKYLGHGSSSEKGDTDEEEDFAVDGPLLKLEQRLDEFLVLLHSLISSDDKKYEDENFLNKENRVRGLIVKFLEEELGQNHLLEKGQISCPLWSFLVMSDENDFDHSDSFRKHMETEPRRTVAKALVISNHRNDNYFDIRDDTKILFHLMREECSIHTNDWYEEFVEWLALHNKNKNSDINSSNSHNEDKDKKEIGGMETWNRFVFAVHQLVHCGVVSRSIRNEGLYEKIAPVWASVGGDGRKV